MRHERLQSHLGSWVFSGHVVCSRCRGARAGTRGGGQSQALADMVKRLYSIGYRGDYSFEVFNDDYQQMPLRTVALRAFKSAQWLGEDVMKRSVPLPNQIRLKRGWASH